MSKVLDEMIAAVAKIQEQDTRPYCIYCRQAINPRLIVSKFLPEKVCFAKKEEVGFAVSYLCDCFLQPKFQMSLKPEEAQS